ncbi:MAG: hypothetical protein FJ008_06780 [Chloroflexi bacterium]|nr:hypothetical protein [Chloroflexota bacterium]
MESSFKAEIEELQTRGDPLTEELERILMRPAKKDIFVRLVALVWVPNWQSADGRLTPAWP